MILENKTVVISGVGPGLGREIAAAALRDGANVVLGARNAERLGQIAKELDATGKRVAFDSADVTDISRCEALMDLAVQRFGAIHAVVQVAALDTLFGTIEDTSSEDWEKALRVNVVGTAQLVRAATPHIKEAGGGSVVLIGSQAMWNPPPMHQIAYAAAKGALRSAMYHMVKELGPDKIRVNMVIPTWMWGPPVEAYVKWQAGERNISQEEVIGEITANMPLGEIPTDGDVAEAVIFFCSNRSRAITGETLMVNAGELMR